MLNGPASLLSTHPRDAGARGIDERTAGDGAWSGKDWGLLLLNTTGMCQAREIMDGGRGQRIPLVAAAEYYPGQPTSRVPKRMSGWPSHVLTAFCAQETDEPTSLSGKERCTIGRTTRRESNSYGVGGVAIPKAQRRARMRYELRV